MILTFPQGRLTTITTTLIQTKAVIQHRQVILTTDRIMSHQQIPQHIKIMNILINLMLIQE